MVKFNFTYDLNISVEQRVGFEMAAAIWSAVLTDDVEVNLHIGATSGLDNDKAVGGAIPIFHKQNYGVFGEYYQQDATLAAASNVPSADAQALASLQEGNTVDLSINGQVVDGNTTLLLTSAQAKALGMDESITLENGTTWNRDLAPADGLDGYIVINNSYDWSHDFTRSGEATEGTLDFLSMALHEIGHNLGFVSGLDGAMDVIQLHSGEVRIEDFTALDLFRHTVDTADIDNADGSVSSVGIGENAYFSIDGGVTNLGDFSTGKNEGAGGDGYQASHWKRLKEAMGIMDPTLAYKERLSLSSLDLQAMDVLGWDVNYQSLNTELDLEALLIQAEQAVAEDFGLVSNAFTTDRLEGNVYSLGYGQLWQLFEEQMLSLGYGQLWQAFELSYGQLWQEAVGSDEMLSLGYGQLWQELENHLFELGYDQLWQAFEEDMLSLGYGQLWQTFELSYGQLWQQLDSHRNTLDNASQSGNGNAGSVIDSESSATSVVVTGGNADDILGGSHHKDLMSGGAGDDLIDGKAGDDVLVGDAGNDILYGFDGKDKLYGGTGDDFLAGESGNDELYGEEGADILSGGYGDDVIDGGDGRDLLKGDDGNDVLYGGAGDDDISGGSGQDIVIGGKGQDTVSGGHGDDTIYGDSHSSVDSAGNSSSVEAIAQQAGLTSAGSESALDFWVRLEAEDFKLKNFNIQEQGIASGNKLIATGGEGTASTKFSGPTGIYNIIVGYYDESDGKGKLELSAGKDNNKTEVEWKLDRYLGNNAAGTNNFVTKTIRNVELASGSKIELEGGEYIRVDYIDVVSTKLNNGEFYNGSLYVQSQSNNYSDRMSEAASLGGSITSAEDASKQHWLNNTFGTTEGIIEIDARSSQFSMVLDEASVEANKTLRVEAEDFNLSSGYQVEQRGGFFSGGAVIADVGDARATTSFTGESGVYDIFVSYLDEASGNSWARAKVNGSTLDTWEFNANNGLTNYRSVGSQVSLDTGDTIELYGWSSGSEKARIDYVDFVSYIAPEEESATNAEDTSSTNNSQIPPTDSGSAAAGSVLVPTGNEFYVEAEHMNLSGNASELGDGFGHGGDFIKLDGDDHNESQASMLFQGESGYYNVVIGYFDVAGNAELRVRQNEEVLDQWQLNQNLGGDEPSMRNFTTRTIATGVYLDKNAETFRITGRKDNDDTGFVDYLQFVEVEPQAPQQPTTPVVIDTDADGSSDILRGGQGNDKLYGGEGDDIIYGEDEFDSSIGTGNNDLLVGGSGNDRLYGNSGDDVLYGDSETAAMSPAGAAVRNGSQYLLSRAGSWEAAQTEAESLGGNLVTINDADEAVWLKDTFVNNQALWIGYTDKASEGQWEWASGEASSYTNWQPWQADGSGDYAAIADSNGQWDDQGGVEGWFNQGSYWSKNAENRGIIEIRLPEEQGGNDTLEGGRGNDMLEGGIGDDRLDGSDAITLGAFEQDILSSGIGSDTFVLGSAAQSYYIADGNSDYALVKDFNASSDTLQLHGSASNYRQRQYGDDLYLYEGQDLVAVLENNQGLVLNSPSVAFV